MVTIIRTVHTFLGRPVKGVREFKTSRLSKNCRVLCMELQSIQCSISHLYVFIAFLLYVPVAIGAQLSVHFHNGFQSDCQCAIQYFVSTCHLSWHVPNKFHRKSSIVPIKHQFQWTHRWLHTHHKLTASSDTLLGVAWAKDGSMLYIKTSHIHRFQKRYQNPKLFLKLLREIYSIFSPTVHILSKLAYINQHDKLCRIYFQDFG